jgi:hypothetical protein
MKTTLIIAVFFTSFVSLAQSSDTQISSRQIGIDSYELKITTSQTTDVAIAQRLLIPGAKQLCGSKEPQFGHYSFDAKEPVAGSSNTVPSTLTLIQQIRCEVSATTAQAQDNLSSAAQWQPTKNDQGEIERLTYKYLHDKDMGHYQDAYGAFTDSMKATVKAEVWQQSAKQFNSKAGQVVKRQVTKVTWYNNPPTSETPGIYAAADYSSQFSNIDIHCGYVAWHQEKNGSFQVVREEENFIDKVTQEKMKESEVAKVKAQFGCVAR